MKSHQSTATPTSNASGPAVQRATCACGRPLGPSGECATCHQKRLQGQFKLAVGQRDDAYEQEADRVAREVLSPSGSPNQRPTISSLPHSSVQRQDRTPSQQEEQSVALPNGGQPLPDPTRRFFEPRLGHDLSHIRIHSGEEAAASARSVNALAYTLGNHVVFGANQFSPQTASGQRLLAHELVHTVQQRSGAARIQRNFDAGVNPPADASLSGGVSEPAETVLEPAPEQGREEGVQAETTFEDVSPATRVERVVISCSDRLISFETLTSIFVYRMRSCRVPVGNYETPVTVTGNDVEFDFGSQVPPELGQTVFRFSYYVRPDQENPASLFSGQDRVAVDVVPSLNVRRRSEQSGCLIRHPDHTLIPYSEPEPIQLFAPIEEEFEIWSRTIPLGHFGWVEVSLMGNVDASGFIHSSYGPGLLRDICLVRQLDRRRLAGRARFTFGARLEPRITIGGGLELAAEYLSFIPVAAIRGNLEANASALLRGDLDAVLDVIYDHVSDEWRFTVTSLISGEVGLSFSLTAGAALQFLGRDLWRETWTLVDANVGSRWQGGLRIGPGGDDVDFDLGALNQNGAEGGASGSSGDGISVPILPMLQRLLEHDPENTEETRETLTGRTKGDPIPMLWYKPPEAYPRAVILDDEEVFRFGSRPRLYTLPDPDVLTRGGSGAADLRRYLEGERTVNVGVNRELIPTRERVESLDEGLVWKKVRSYRSALGGEVQRAFRFLMIAHGHDMRARDEDADHVKDLQFEGPDDFYNMWPLESGVNRSSRRFAEQEVTFTDDSGQPQTTQLDDPMLRNRYFRIIGFRLF